MADYSVKGGYIIRKKPVYFEDNVTNTTIWQPDVYTAVAALARKSGADTIVDIGSGSGEKLLPYKKEFKFIFVDFGPNLKIIKKNFGSKGNKYIDQDFETGFPKIPDATLKKSIVVCSDVLEHMIKPDKLMKSLAELSKAAPFVVISTPDRLRTRGVDHFGPPQNQTHVREWSMEELDTQFRTFGLKKLLTGITRSNDYEQVRRTIAIVSGTYINDLMREPTEIPDVQAWYKTHMEFAKSFYKNEDIEIVKESAEPTIELMPEEWLTSPNLQLSIGSIIKDAQNKGYKSVDAQVIEINPDDTYSWPEAGLIRQGHGLIGQIKEVRNLKINKAKGSQTYPLQLIIFKLKQTGKLRLIKSKKSDNSLKLIDTGHLTDDFFLESLLGWKTLHK